MWGEKLLVPRESPRRSLLGELAGVGEPGRGSTCVDGNTTDSLAQPAAPGDPGWKSDTEQGTSRHQTPSVMDLFGGPDLPLKDFNFLLCVLEDYFYFLKLVQQVCPPIAYFSIMNLYKLGNCVCKWVVRCLTTNRCVCGCVITGFAFVNPHFLKQPSPHPYFSATSLSPSAHVPRCMAWPGVPLRCAPGRQRKPPQGPSSVPPYPCAPPPPPHK